MSAQPTPFKYLVRKPRSVYKQLFVKDRWIAARTLYGKYVNEDEPMSVEEIAADYDLPIEAVREAIAYCESNPPEIAGDLARDEALMKAVGITDPDYKKNPSPRLLSSQEMARLNRLQSAARHERA